MGYLDGYVIKKARNPVLSIGWIHHAVFYINDKKAMSITFGDPMTIDENYYDIIKGNLDTDKIDKFLKLINPEYIIGI
ncbi:hypothetical protein Desor_5586 [Desulfosporosinus orientis DSM 765]|uniref:Uncharacterized protein n=2 Tax=Desulfosporosinus orientis TaxID=1563 RepID=G7WI35_DESOD|nr:hypothetical protein Desor_5586 [Desulfosporosinus orientis DSM 765]